MKGKLAFSAAIVSCTVSGLWLLAPPGDIPEKTALSDGCKGAVWAFPDIAKNIESRTFDAVDPHWVDVRQSEKPFDLYKHTADGTYRLHHGTGQDAWITEVYVTHTDFPLDHESHDLCFGVSTVNLPRAVRSTGNKPGAIE